MNTINLAVVGLGYWGPNIVRNLLTISKVNNVYIYDKDSSKLNYCKENFPRVHVSQSYEEILKNESVTGIIIATPLSSHYSLALQALKAKKNIFVEKPMCESSVKAKKLISAANRAEKILMAGHTFIYSETIKKIKLLVKSES